MVFDLIKVCLCLLFILRPACLPAQPDDVPLGYGLGMHFDSIPKENLLKMGRFQKLWRYDRQDEGLSFNGMRLSHVRLFIWDNRLHSMEIKVTGEDAGNYRAFLAALYGPGDPLDAMGSRCQWLQPAMRVLWCQNLLTKEGIATYVDEKTNGSYFEFMHRQQNRW